MYVIYLYPSHSLFISVSNIYRHQLTPYSLQYTHTHTHTRYIKPDDLYNFITVDNSPIPITTFCRLPQPSMHFAYFL